MAVQALCSPELILTLHHQLKSKFRRSTELCRSTWKICQNMVRTTLHLKYSWALPFSSCSYMLKLWVDSVCPQMTVAKVENCWLYDSYPPVPPPMISHMQHAFRQANFACHSTPLFTKWKAFHSACLIGVLGPVWRQVSRHWPPGPIQHTTAQLCFIL